MQLRYAVIPQSWLRITRMLGAEVHVNLMEEVLACGVDPADLDAVSEVWSGLQQQAIAEAIELRKRSDERAAEEMADRERRQDLTWKFPQIRKYFSD